MWCCRAHVQVTRMAQALATRQGVPLERMYLWMDWPCVDQHNPMPGVQARWLLVCQVPCWQFMNVVHLIVPRDT